MKKCREDCYFYYKSQEMSAYVPNCSYDSKYEYGFCPCDENCKHYISRKEAHELIKKIVLCKDCKHRGDRNKCIVAFVAEKHEMPYFFYDNRGEWFCADGERKNDG